MTDLLEIRCTCKDQHGKHPLLAKVGGSSYQVELKCRRCKRLVVVRRPHPLQPKVLSEVADRGNNLAPQSHV